MIGDTLQKHTLNLYKGDFERMSELYPRCGASVAIREIIHKFIGDINKKQNANVPVTLSTEITVQITEDTQ